MNGPHTTGDVGIKGSGDLVCAYSSYFAWPGALPTASRLDGLRCRALDGLWKVVERSARSTGSARIRWQ